MEDEIYIDLARQLLDGYTEVKRVDVEELAEAIQKKAEEWLREWEERRL